MGQTWNNVMGYILIERQWMALRQNICTDPPDFILCFHYTGLCFPFLGRDTSNSFWNPKKVLSKFAKIFSIAATKFSCFILTRAYQDLIKIYHQILVFQILGKIFQVLPEMSRSSMSYQGLPSFVTGRWYSRW